MNKYLIIFCIIILAIIITVSVVLTLNNKNNKTPKKTITPPGIWHPPFTLITPEEFAQFMLDNSIINEQEYVEILKDKDPNNINKQSLTTTANQINTTYTNTLSLDVVSYNKIKNSLASLLLYVPDNLRNNIISKFNKLKLNPTTLFLAAVSQCKPMNGKIAVGIIVVESALTGGPIFTNPDKSLLLSSVKKAQAALKSMQPAKDIVWYNDIQQVKIDVENGPVIPYGSKTSMWTYDKYWRDPAVPKIKYNNKSFTTMQSYLDAIKLANGCDKSICIFLTPYETAYPAYAVFSYSTFILSSNKKYAGWGIDQAWKVLSHEICHLFGAMDEYSSAIGTSCTSCTSPGGCNNYPNTNCEQCNPNAVPCLMIKNDPAYMCSATKMHIGWTAQILTVDITTSKTKNSGTDNDIYITFKTVSGKKKSYLLDNSMKNDFESGNTDIFYIEVPNVPNVDLLIPEEFYIEIKPLFGFYYDDWLLESISIYENNVLKKYEIPLVLMSSKNRIWPSAF